MYIQLRRSIPPAVFVLALYAAALGVAASPSICRGQDVEAESGDAPPAQPEPPVSEEKGEKAAPVAGKPADKPTEVSGDKPPAAARIEEKPAAEKKATRPSLDPASLDGVRPGSTTRQELHEKWGKPRQVERIAGGAREMYQLDKLGRVRATIVEDVVDSLSVHVEQPLAIAVVAVRLAIDDVEPVAVYDEQGELLGAAYPPRGVLLGYVPRSNPPRVFQVVVEKIDAQAFLARAEVRLTTRYADCLADVRQALELAPDSGLAHRLHAEVSLRSGDLDAALTAAQKAIELEPDQPAHRLCLARVLAAAGDYPQAISRVRDVLDQPNVPDVVAAGAWCQWGDYLAKSSDRDYAGAIKHHRQAIKLAEPLARHERYVVRRAAKELLVDAHLAVAYDVGWGRWQQKSKVVPKWIDRAASFADEMLANERGDAEVYLRVYAGALAALAGIAEPPEASKWIRGIQQHGKRMVDGAADPAYRARLAWEIANGLSHAVEITAARHQPDEAIKLAKAAIVLFDESSPLAARLPMYSYERGQLSYLLGAVYAVERGDHTLAVGWYDRAAPLLEKPVPVAAVNAGTQGETFVSMAVSYWELNNRPEALRLTSQGLKFMEQAVRDGALATRALAIPYNNLASMHEALGDLDEARKCSELAARYESEAATK
ncbi:MAG: tetratricopeptide repeat protein [Pirellulales bacterium]